jgi:hypothetical protein
MDWVVDLFNMILSGFQAVVDFISKDVFELFRQMGEFLYSFVEMCFYDVLNFCCSALDYILNLVFGQIDLTGPILDSWISMTTETREALVFFRIPQILIIYFSALSLRVLRMLIPFL